MSKKTLIELIIISLIISGCLIFLVDIVAVSKHYSGANYEICYDCSTEHYYGFPLVYKTRSSGGWNWGVVDYNMYNQIIDYAIIMIFSFTLVFGVNYFLKIFGKKKMKKLKVKK